MKKICLLFAFLFWAQTSHAAVEKWNRWIGYPLLNDAWQYDARLRLPGDDKLKSAYLRNTFFCGVMAQELKYHLDQDKITSVEIVFSNKGDVADHARRAIAQAKKHLHDDLTRLAGKPEKGKFGLARFKNKAEIWETPDAVFALEADAGDYVILHIYPPGKTPQMQSSGDVRKKIRQLDLPGRIRRNSFGDVFLVIPQIDQGGKGYCVPATYARILRYYEIDSVGMHQLAALFNSDREDGTQLKDSYKKISPIFRSVGINIRNQGDIAFPAIRKAIDNGTPLVWILFADPRYEDIRSRNTQLRGGDPKSWRRNKITKSKRNSLPKEDCGHACLIVGYNLLTDEIAVSNSWQSESDGKPTWVPFRVAKKFSAGESYLCEP
ncbi:MAG: hypothetical protein MJ033_00135 [Victivallaceae bacterium]|nr:hypothetical protein [Victivallaceae bacterium]